MKYLESELKCTSYSCRTEKEHWWGLNFLVFLIRFPFLMTYYKTNSSRSKMIVRTFLWIWFFHPFMKWVKPEWVGCGLGHRKYTLLVTTWLTERKQCHSFLWAGVKYVFRLITVKFKCRERIKTVFLLCVRVLGRNWIVLMRMLRFPNEWRKWSEKFEKH